MNVPEKYIHSILKIKRGKLKIKWQNSKNLEKKDFLGLEIYKMKKGKISKKPKLTTPDWILEGYDSEEEYNKKKGIKGKKSTNEKTFKVRKCPKCGSDNVAVVLVGEEGKKADNWECKKCKWTGKNVKEQELTETEFMKYLDDKGEEVL